MKFIGHVVLRPVGFFATVLISFVERGTIHVGRAFAEVFHPLAAFLSPCADAVAGFFAERVVARFLSLALSPAFALADAHGGFVQIVERCHHRGRVVHLLHEVLQFLGCVGERLRGVGFVAVLHLFGGLFHQVGNFAVFGGFRKSLGNLFENFFELLRREVSGLELLGQFFQRVGGGFGLTVLELLGEVFAHLLRLSLHGFELLFHVAQLLEVVERGFDVFHETIRVIGGERGDGFVNLR